MKPHDRRFPPMRGINPALRRARLVAARERGAGCARHAILRGQWDGGDAVRKHMEGAA